MFALAILLYPLGFHQQRKDSTILTARLLLLLPQSIQSFELKPFYFSIFILLFYSMKHHSLTTLTLLLSGFHVLDRPPDHLNFMSSLPYTAIVWKIKSVDLFLYGILLNSFHPSCVDLGTSYRNIDACLAIVI